MLRMKFVSSSSSGCSLRLKDVLRSSRKYTTTSAKETTFDVVCIGGGPAGLSLLSALRTFLLRKEWRAADCEVGASRKTSHLKLALVEGQDLQRVRQWKNPQNHYSNRVSSLTPSSIAFLQEIGAWQNIERSRIQPYSEMHVWDSLSQSRISFPGEDLKNASETLPNIAYMCENLNLTAGLIARLDHLGGLSVFDKTRVQSISLDGKASTSKSSEWPIINLENGQTLKARLLIGADGFNSPVRAFAGIKSRGWDYDRHGLVATVELSTSNRDRGLPVTAYQRFLPTGPVALLPLPGNFASLVWSTLPHHASFLKNLESADLVAMINAAFRLSPTDLTYLHTIDRGQTEESLWREEHTPFDSNLVPPHILAVQDGTLASFPLRLSHADTYHSSRVALIGDAAHTIHPLAGQGLNQGQGDVQSLARTLEYAVEHGQDIGDSLTLESYTSRRYVSNNTLLGVVDKLHKLYAVDSGPLIPLRSWGLNVVNSLPPLKSFFMRQAAGQSSF